jgi:hypothetical protein
MHPSQVTKIAKIDQFAPNLHFPPKITRSNYKILSKKEGEVALSI